ncbi:MAG: hypothetical protein NTX50_14030 [Candidatus Sumerlaeota bacterium]|nr:hypothetical protein [Candidatus Sumerlaeota bacterium]
MIHNWRTALLWQAFYDYCMFRYLARNKEIEGCHRFHYLQMATEKLAKALESDGLRSPKQSHTAFKELINKAYDRPESFPEVKYACANRNDHEIRKYLERLSDAAQAVVGLAPQDKEHFNSEYPWEERRLLPDGSIGITIQVPAIFDFDEWETNQPAILELYSFLHACFVAVLDELPNSAVDYLCG